MLLGLEVNWGAPPVEEAIGSEPNSDIKGAGIVEAPSADEALGLAPNSELEELEIVEAPSADEALDLAPNSELEELEIIDDDFLKSKSSFGFSMVKGAEHDEQATDL